MSIRTFVHNRTSATENTGRRRYNDGTNETAPGGATNTVIPGPCRLTRSRLVTHHRTLSRPPNITQMGGS